MLRPPLHAPLCLAIMSCFWALSGCAMQQTAAPVAFGLPAISGTVHGGQQPVSYSTLQLYAAGSTGYASAATPLIPSGSYYLGGAPGCVASGTQTCYPGVVSDATGSFSISSDYTCPSATTQVYLVATGGNPGLTTGTNNPALALMAALGSCGNLTVATDIVVNEVTTVAAVWSLRQFMTDYAHVGTSATNAAGLARSFSTASSLANVACGCATANVYGGFTYWPQANLNSLANILAACVNSTGSTVTGMPCTSLFSAAAGTSTPADTLGAALNIASHPGTNVSSLYALSTSTAPFQPALTGAPNDWLVGVSYSENVKFYDTSGVDRQGGFWVSYNYVFSGAGTVGLGSSQYVEETAYGSAYFAFDSSNRLWIVFGQNSTFTGAVLQVFNASSQQVASFALGSSGLTTPKVVADASGNIWLSTSSATTVYSPSTLAAIATGPSMTLGLADATGGLWTSNSSSLLRTALSGSAITSATYTGPGFTTAPTALDSTGLWALNPDSTLSKLTPSGSAYTVTNGITGGGLNASSGGSIAVDGDGNIWAANVATNNLSEIANNGTPVSPAAGYANYINPAYLSIQPIIDPVNIAVGISGDVWVIGSEGSSPSLPYGYTITVFVGAAAPLSTTAPGTRP